MRAHSDRLSVVKRSTWLALLVTLCRAPVAVAEAPPRLGFVVGLVEGSAAPSRGASEIQIAGVSPAKLEQLFAFETLRLLGQRSFDIAGGEQWDRQLGADYRIRFWTSLPSSGDVVELRDLEFSRTSPSGASERLLRADVILHFERPLVIGLAGGESSRRALLLILSCSRQGGKIP